MVRIDTSANTKHRSRRNSILLILRATLVAAPLLSIVLLSWSAFAAHESAAATLIDLPAVAVGKHERQQQHTHQQQHELEQLAEKRKNIKTNVAAVWRQIDDTTAQYASSNAKISGGLFLYPRQADLLATLISDLSHVKKNKDVNIQTSSSYRQQQQPFQVCETGFGSGHSTAFFLSQSPNVHIVTFDKFDRPYQIPVVRRLETIFPNRITHVKGNSCRTVPKFFSKRDKEKHTSRNNTLDGPAGNGDCDILHGSSFCKSDNIDLVHHAVTKCATVLTSTAMHSLSDKEVYFGPNAQWRKLRQDGCISDITCFKEDPRTLDRSFIFAQSDQVITHQFCFAMVTGMCTDTLKGKSDDARCEKKKTAVRDILNNLGRLYDIDRVEVPV